MLPSPHVESQPTFLELVLLEKNQGIKMIWMFFNVKQLILYRISLNEGYNINIRWVIYATMGTTRRRKQPKQWTLSTKTFRCASSPFEKHANCCWFWVRVRRPRNLSIPSIVNSSANHSIGLLRILSRTALVLPELLNSAGAGDRGEK